LWKCGDCTVLRAQADANDVLGEKLREFAESLSEPIRSVEAIAGAYQLTEVALETALDAECGFALITKAGVRGSVSLKFTRAPV
jgi:hypothetical protein